MLKDQIEADQPGKFVVSTQRDPTRTGNFEVFLHRNADHSDAPVQVWSKKAKGSFPVDNEDNWNEMMSNISKAL